MGIESFSLSDGNRFGKNAIIFSANMSSSMHDDNKKNILILITGQTQWQDNPMLTAEKKTFYKFY